MRRDRIEVLPGTEECFLAQVECSLFVTCQIPQIAEDASLEAPKEILKGMVGLQSTPHRGWCHWPMLPVRGRRRLPCAELQVCAQPLRPGVRSRYCVRSPCQSIRNCHRPSIACFTGTRDQWSPDQLIAGQFRPE